MSCILDLRYNPPGDAYSSGYSLKSRWSQGLVMNDPCECGGQFQAITIPQFPSPGYSRHITSMCQRLFYETQTGVARWLWGAGVNPEIRCQCGAAGSRGKRSMSSMLCSPVTCPGSSAMKSQSRSRYATVQPQTQSPPRPLDARGGQERPETPRSGLLEAMQPGQSGIRVRATSYQKDKHTTGAGQGYAAREGQQ